MTTLQNAMFTLDRIGVVDIVLPFILIFTVSYAVLMKVRIFGKDNSKFNVMIALVMALAVVFPHVTGRGPDVVPTINNALPNVAAVIVALVMLMVLLGVWGEEWSIGDKPIASWVVILSVGAIIYIFGAAAGWGWRVPNSLRFLLGRDTQILLVTLLVFGLIVGYITRDPDQAKDKKLSKTIEDYANVFNRNR